MRFLKVVLLAAVLSLFPLPGEGALVHRYSFDGNAGGTVIDSVGSANGHLIGQGEFGNGQLKLFGNGGYVDLPNGIISRLNQVTIEIWATWNGYAPDGRLVWQRLFDFGNNGPEEDREGNGATYLAFSPCGSPLTAGVVGLTSRFIIGNAGNLGEESGKMDGPVPAVNREVHFVITYNPATRVAAYYQNGQLITTQNALINLNEIIDVNNWLGRSNYTADPTFAGVYNEVRIYDHALTSDEVRTSHSFGPDLVPGNFGTLESLVLYLPDPLLSGQTRSLKLSGTYSSGKTAELRAHPSTIYTLGDTDIAEITQTGELRALRPGETTLTVAHGTLQTSSPLLVLPLHAEHRYSFSSGDTEPDRIGKASALVIGGEVQEGRLITDGIDDYVDLPNGLISQFSIGNQRPLQLDPMKDDPDTADCLTLEMWISWAGNPTTLIWQRIFDFGNSDLGEGNQGLGQTYLFLSPKGLFAGAPGGTAMEFLIRKPHNYIVQLNQQTPIPPGQEVHIVVTYSLKDRQLKYYVNGQWIGSATTWMPLNSIIDENVWLGRSQFPDPYFGGNYNEFRVYGGALSDHEVQASFEAGPDAEGSFIGIALELEGPFPVGSERQAKVWARQTLLAREITNDPEVQYLSSDPEKATITQQGLVKAISPGKVSISAQYQGKIATKEISIPAPPVLKILEVTRSEATLDFLVEASDPYAFMTLEERGDLERGNWEQRIDAVFSVLSEDRLLIMCPIPEISPMFYRIKRF